MGSVNKPSESFNQLTNFVRTYDNAISPEFCASVVDLFERDTHRQKRNGGNIRAGLEESSWMEMDLSNCQEMGIANIFANCLKHFKPVYERDCGIRPALPEPPGLAELIVKRYDPGGDQFQPHYDAVGPVASRYMVFLWYLNDVAEGGETEFTDLGVKSVPTAGRLLIFPPYWMYRHMGRPPVSGPKYIISTYTLW
jgi:hypothetical protein